MAPFPISKAIFLVTVLAIGSNVLAQSVPSAQVNAANDPLPGIVSLPTPLPGNRRWQIFTKNPPSAVQAVAWSPEGRWFCLATGQIVRIYDATGTPKLERVLVGHTESIRAVHFSNDGKFIATASLDGTARIWTAEGQQVLVYREHADSVQDVSWHPDNKRLATASADGTVQIWSVDGKSLKVITDHQASVNAVAWSPDGKFLASGCENKAIRLWSPEGNEGPVLNGHLGAIESVAWTPDSQRLLSCDHGVEAIQGINSDLAHAKVWDTSGNQIASLDLVDSLPSHVTWSFDGTKALVAGTSNVRVWDYQKNDVAGFGGPRAVIVPIAWRPSSDCFAAGPYLHHVDNRKMEALPLRNFKVYSVDVAKGDKLIAVGCGDQTISLFNDEGKLIHRSEPIVKNGLGIYACRWNPEGTTLAAAVRGTQDVHFFDTAGKAKGMAIPVPGFSPRSLNWSADGKRMVVGGDSMSVGLVDVANRTVIGLGRQLHGITQVQFTPDQKDVCSAGYDGCVRFWTLDGKEGPVLEAVAAQIRGMDWADDGKTLATGHEDFSIRLWNENGTPEAIIGGHGGFVESVDFNPQGTMLASGGWDHTVRLWKRDGTPVSVLRGHEGALGMVRWSHDGRRLYSSALDGTVRCWDPETGIAIWTILFADSGQSVTLDSNGGIMSGDKKVLDSDFVIFSEDERDQLIRTKEADISKAIRSAK